MRKKTHISGSYRFYLNFYQKAKLIQDAVPQKLGQFFNERSNYLTGQKIRNTGNTDRLILQLKSGIYHQISKIKVFWHKRISLPHNIELLYQKSPNLLDYNDTIILLPNYILLCIMSKFRQDTYIRLPDVTFCVQLIFIL